MNDYPWCHGCPLCEGGNSDTVHLYLDDSNSHLAEGDLTLGLFGTRQVRYWGEQNSSTRVNLGKAPNQIFHFADITRSPKCLRARLGREILDGLTKAPLKFVAKGLVAPHSDRDRAEFAKPSERLRFYIRQFAGMAMKKFSARVVIILARGPQDGDGHFGERLQEELNDLRQKRKHAEVAVVTHNTDDCLLLQIADLTAGCTRQLHERGGNINKVQLALDFHARLGLTNKRFERITWDWYRFHGVPN